MEAATAPPASTANGQDGGPLPEPAAPAKQREPIDYHVFEAPGTTLKKGDTLTYLGTTSALNKTEARWAIVDGDKKLAERTAAELPEGVEPLFLLAVAARNATPELTVEEAVVQKKRR